MEYEYRKGKGGGDGMKEGEEGMEIGGRRIK